MRFEWIIHIRAQVFPTRSPLTKRINKKDNLFLPEMGATSFTICLFRRNNEGQSFALRASYRAIPINIGCCKL